VTSAVVLPFFTFFRRRRKPAATVKRVSPLSSADAVPARRRLCAQDSALLSYNYGSKKRELLRKYPRCNLLEDLSKPSFKIGNVMFKQHPLPDASALQ